MREVLLELWAIFEVAPACSIIPEPTSKVSTPPPPYTGREVLYLMPAIPAAPVLGSTNPTFEGAGEPPPSNKLPNQGMGD